MFRTTASGRRHGVRFLVPAWLAMVLTVAMAATVAQPVAAATVEAPVVAFAAVEGSCCGSGTVVAFNANTGAVLGTVAVGARPQASP